jgi:hypothetical protein
VTVCGHLVGGVESGGVRPRPDGLARDAAEGAAAGTADKMER